MLAGHPYLIRRNPGDETHPNDLRVSDEEFFGDLAAAADHPPSVDDTEELARAVASCGQAFVEKVKKSFFDRQILLTEAVKTDDEEAKREGECPVCFDLDLSDERVCGPCGHSFCASCIDNLFNSLAADATDLSDEQTQRGVRKCPLCRGPCERAKTFRASAFEEHGPEEGNLNLDVKDEDEGISSGCSKLNGKKRAVRVSPSALLR